MLSGERGLSGSSQTLRQPAADPSRLSGAQRLLDKMGLVFGARGSHACLNHYWLLIHEQLGTVAKGQGGRSQLIKAIWGGVYYIMTYFHDGDINMVSLMKGHMRCGASL